MASRCTCEEMKVWTVNALAGRVTPRTKWQSRDLDPEAAGLESVRGMVDHSPPPPGPELFLLGAFEHAAASAWVSLSRPNQRPCIGRMAGRKLESIMLDRRHVVSRDTLVGDTEKSMRPKGRQN